MPVFQYGIRNSVFGMDTAGEWAGQAGTVDLDSGQFCPNRLTFGQNCPILRLQTLWAKMDKRDRFIAEIRTEARAMGLSFRVDYRKGKGGHAMVYVGDKLTTLPSREIDPKTARKIRKQLGLAD